MPSIPHRVLIKTAFENLTNQGFFAVLPEDFVGHTCCAGCMGGEVDQQLKAEDQPYVFFHDQDDEHGFGSKEDIDEGGDSWGMDREDRLVGPLPLRFGPDTAAGVKIVAALAKQQLDVEWDGSLERCIYVNP